MDPKQIEELLELLQDTQTYYDQPCYYDNTPKEIQDEDQAKLDRATAALRDMLG